MKHNLVGWFEIPVTDLDRAQGFYEAVFNVSMDRQPEKDGFTMVWFPMILEGGGAAGTLVKAEGFTPSHDGTLVYFTAPEGNIEATLERVESNGGKTLTPKRSIGEHGFIAWFEDTEGNRVALHSMTE